MLKLGLSFGHVEGECQHDLAAALSADWLRLRLFHGHRARSEVRVFTSCLRSFRYVYKMNGLFVAVVLCLYACVCMLTAGRTADSTV